MHISYKSKASTDGVSGSAAVFSVGESNCEVLLNTIKERQKPKKHNMNS